MSNPEQVHSEKTDVESGIQERIRGIMASRKLTARSLSRQTGIPYRSLQNYLRGEHVMPSPALRKISDVLGVSADWLLSERAATFDHDILIDSLNIFEDVRSLSDHKTTVDEAARLFEK